MSKLIVGQKLHKKFVGKEVMPPTLPAFKKNPFQAPATPMRSLPEVAPGKASLQIPCLGRKLFISPPIRTETTMLFNENMLSQANFYDGKLANYLKIEQINT